MTGLRALPMRRKCAWCKSPFRPNRADAEFCTSLCRQAAYRIRKKKSEAATQHEVQLRIAQNAHDARYRLEECQSIAARLHIEADACGIKHVKFMGTSRGVLAVEEIPGAIGPAIARTDWPGASTLRRYHETEARSDDREVLALIQQPVGGSSFIAKESENACRALLKGPAKKVSFFVWDWDFFVTGSKEQGTLRQLPQHWSYWDDEGSDWKHQQVGESGEELLAGGGYQIETP